MWFTVFHSKQEIVCITRQLFSNTRQLKRDNDIVTSKAKESKHTSFFLFLFLPVGCDMKAAVSLKRTTKKLATHWQIMLSMHFYTSCSCRWHATSDKSCCAFILEASVWCQKKTHEDTLAFFLQEDEHTGTLSMISFCLNGGWSFYTISNYSHHSQSVQWLVLSKLP